MNEPTFSTLLYRYLFVGWLFRPVPAGSMWQRSAAVRHNRRQARWLPTYMTRWLGIGLLLYAAAAGVEATLGEPVTARWLYAFSAMGVAYTVALATAWVGLTQDTDGM